MLQLHLVVKESFFVVNKRTGPTTDIMILFYCFWNPEYFETPWRHIDVDMTSFLPKMYDFKKNISQIDGVPH